jgi:tetratricopeptide (TPR) repeat protein
MKRWMILLSAALFCGAWAAPARAQDPNDTALRLIEEQERVQQLRGKLKLAEAQTAEADQTRFRLQKGLDTASLDRLPDSVTAEDMEVKRSLGTNGLVYDVTCSRVPAVQLLDAISATSGFPLDIHAETERDSLLGRVSLNVAQEDLADVLRIVCGTQGLGASLGERGITVAPISALSPVPVEKILREMAVESYQAALLRYPASRRAPMAYLGIARYYAKTGFEETAIETLQSLLNRDSQSEATGPALALMGDCLASLRRFNKARAAYYGYVDGYPGAPDVPAVLMKIGATWIEEKKWDQAIPVFESVFRAYSNASEAPYARMRLAECLTQQQQYEKALEQLKVLEQQSRQFAKHYELRLVLAECLMHLNRYGAARVYLKQVAEVSGDPLLAEKAGYILGDTFLAESSSLAAAEAYRSAMVSFPTGRLRPEAPLRLARVYLQMGLCARAEDYLRSVTGTGVAYSEVRPVIIEVARYHLDIGDAERALSLLDQLPDRDASADTRLLAAEACLRIGRIPQAMAHAGAAARLSPEDESLRSQAARIIGRCQEAVNKPVLAALAYGGANE